MLLEGRENLKMLLERLEENGCQAVVCGGLEGLYSNLDLILNRFEIGSAAFYPRGRLKSLPSRLSGRIVQVNNDMAAADLAGFKLAITEFDYALAESGSLVIFTESMVERLVTCLPETLLGVVWADRILPSLTSHHSVIAANVADGKVVSIISGPSKTLDIEQTFVTGVHGPDRVMALIVVEE